MNLTNVDFDEGNRSIRNSTNNNVNTEIAMINEVAAMICACKQIEIEGENESEREKEIIKYTFIYEIKSADWAFYY